MLRLGGPMLGLGGPMLRHRRGEAAVALTPVELALRHAPTVHEVLRSSVGFQGPRGAVAGPVLRRRAHQPRKQLGLGTPNLQSFHNVIWSFIMVAIIVLQSVFILVSQQ